MSDYSQKKLQRQLVKLGWTIGQDERKDYAYAEMIQMRQLSKVIQKKESPEDDTNESVDQKNNYESTKHKQHEF